MAIVHYVEGEWRDAELTGLLSPKGADMRALPQAMPLMLRALPTHTSPSRLVGYVSIACFPLDSPLSFPPHHLDDSGIHRAHVLEV